MIIEIGNGVGSASSDKFTSATIEIVYDSRQDGYIKRFSGNLALADGEEIMQFLEENLTGLTVTIMENDLPLTTPIINGQVVNAFRDLINKVCMMVINTSIGEV